LNHLLQKMGVGLGIDRHAATSRPHDAEIGDDKKHRIVGPQQDIIVAGKMPGFQPRADGHNPLICQGITERFIRPQN